MSDIIPDNSNNKDGVYTELQCFPLYSVLMAVGNPTVNLFSLDVEGAEFQVLLFVNFMK